MIHRMLASVLPIALVVCVSSLEKSAIAGTDATSGAGADRPDIKVGDRWKFQCVDYYGVKSERLWLVATVDQSGIKATENGKSLLLTSDLNEMESPRRKDSNRMLLSFPLVVGKQWDFNDKFIEQESRTGSEGSGKGSVAVASHEKVRVGAGEFDAFKLESSTDLSWNNGRRTSTSTSKSTYWYAPAARAIVKIGTFANGAEHSCELVEFQLQP